MKRLGDSILLVLFLGLLVIALPTGPARADSGLWTGIPGSNPSSRRTDATGYLNRVDEMPNGIDPAALSFARLTSGSCDDDPDDAFVIEGLLKPSGSVYTGLLDPIGAVARGYPALAPGALEIRAAGTGIQGGRVFVTGFVNGPPNTSINLCLRPPDPPGTYCFAWNDTVICRRQIATGPAPGPLTISAGPTYYGVVNTPITFTSTGGNLPEGANYAVSWNFGDGTAARGAIVSHTYTGPGTYQVSVSLALHPSGVVLAEDRTTAVITSTPEVTGWYIIGTSTSDEAGAWRFKASAGQDLIDMGLTMLRVTASASCGTSVADAIVFEARLQATESEDGSWGGMLEPLGAPALALVFQPSSGDVHFTPKPDGTLIDAALDGVPPTTTFAVCVRKP